MVEAILWAALWFFVFLPLGTWAIVLGLGGALKERVFSGWAAVVLILAWAWSVFCIIMAIINVINAISIAVNGAG